MTDTIKYRCPDCGCETSLYLRADVRWNPATQAWVYVDGSAEDYAADCTECDWQGPLADCEEETDQ